MGFKRISAEQESIAIDRLVAGDSLTNVSALLGFKSHQQFFRYRRAFPEFDAQCLEARLMNCEIREDELLNIVETYPDPKQADVASRAIMRVLSYRDPRRYGEKMDLNVNQTVDISGALARAERVVLDASKVIPLLPSKKPAE